MQPYREIVKITEPMRKLQKQWAEQSMAIQKAIEPTLELQKKLNEPLINFRKSFENINKIYASIPKFENPFLDHLETFREIGERLKEYAKNTPDNFLLIAQYGWFIDLECELNFPSKVAYELQNDKLETANKLLVEYYRENINQIFERLINRHPNRKEILTQILDGFKKGYHSLIIPTVLTQVDGICFDFTKRKFFIKDKNNNYLPQVTGELEKSSGTFLKLFLTPLQNQTPIMAWEKDIPNFPCHLNRHEVLHGINFEYGTEINSLKVISLLKYISDLLTDLDEKTLSTTMYIRHWACGS